MELQIKHVPYNSPDYWQMVALRRAILRAPLGLDFTPEQLAIEGEDYHIGAWVGEDLIGCLVLEPLANDILKMRQVAVRPEWQGQGVGTALVRYAETFALQLGYRKLVLHARETAVSFYLRLGYTVEGEPFEEVTIPHRLMYKWLT
ncbi:acetyltransferase [Chthonomonas calidirosea]|uniref:GNAT family N-acetyltransferase n=1 Tax=Chthonomonas calidirosea TaxID=454171 RepID=UPI0006DD3D38|nr:GNAT family N-acetyltransferase [Chthonomonas calidirosea]CEK20076.1 acetyltransferase [Chthonomonas calidirosea]